MRIVIAGTLCALLFALPAGATAVAAAHALMDPATPLETCVRAGQIAVERAGLQVQAISSSSVNATNPAGDAYLIVCVQERGVVTISGATAGTIQQVEPVVRHLIDLFGKP
ncbi:hypothetical protein [Muricoccus radiodurans]|uniref:hypothetical protein n=1 Tax=Muricoccus radiodurans TaxID=2231721 RepID=UPI003CEB8951